MINRIVVVIVLLLSLIVGCSTDSSPITTESRNEKPPASANSQSTPVQESHLDRPSIDNQSTKALNCDDPKGYSVKEEAEPGIHAVNIVSDATVVHAIKLPTDAEVNGFGFDGVKKTKAGFEIAIQYGTRIFYAKRFIFICKHNRFYLSKITVESFDRQNPEKWSRKVITVRPNVPLEKFSITDFIL